MTITANEITELTTHMCQRTRPNSIPAPVDAEVLGSIRGRVAIKCRSATG